MPSARSSSCTGDTCGGGGFVPTIILRQQTRRRRRRRTSADHDSHLDHDRSRSSILACSDDNVYGYVPQLLSLVVSGGFLFNPRMLRLFGSTCGPPSRENTTAQNKRIHEHPAKEEEEDYISCSLIRQKTNKPPIPLPAAQLLRYSEKKKKQEGAASKQHHLQDDDDDDNHPPPASPPSSASPSSSSHETLTVAELRARVRSTAPERGVLSRLKRKRDLVEYLERRERQERVTTTYNGANGANGARIIMPTLQMRLFFRQNRTTTTTQKSRLLCACHHRNNRSSSRYESPKGLIVEKVYQRYPSLVRPTTTTDTTTPKDGSRRMTTTSTPKSTSGSGTIPF